MPIALEIVIENENEDDNETRLEDENGNEA
jgi:hypothetical protein